MGEEIIKSGGEVSPVGGRKLDISGQPPLQLSPHWRVKPNGGVFNDFSTTPGIALAQDALRSTRELSDKLTSVTNQFNQQIYASGINETLTTFQKGLDRLNDFIPLTVPSSLNDVLNSAALAATTPFVHEPLMAAPTYMPWLQSPDTVSIIKEGLKELASRIEQKIEAAVTGTFDKLMEEGIIPSDLRDVNCYCVKCSSLLFKVMEMSHFIRGTIKCKCGETLQIPKDLKIETVKS